MEYQLFYWTVGILYVVNQSIIAKKKIVKEVFCLIVLFYLLSSWNALEIIKWVETLFFGVSALCILNPLINLSICTWRLYDENIILNIIICVQWSIIFLTSYLKILQVHCEFNIPLPLLWTSQSLIIEKTIFQLGVLVVTTLSKPHHPLLHMIYTILLPHEWTIAYMVVQTFNGFTKNMMWVLVWFTLDIVRTKCQNWWIL
jgi:hypothetical protein